MSWLRYFRRKSWDEERAREIESYLDIETAANIARGMSHRDSVAAARRKFGNPTRIREDIYQMNTLTMLESTLQDLRYAARQLRLNPGFFAIAALSLVLGIGANTAIFQLVNAVRLQTLPVPHPEQLARLEIAKNPDCCSGNFTGRFTDFTFAQWEQIRDRQQAFSGIFAWGDKRFNLSRGGEAQYAEGLFVSGDFFRTLGVAPALGRLITADDDRAGCGSPGAVISYPFWQGHLGRDPRVVGKTLYLEGHAVPVIGVAAAGFFGVEVGRQFDVAVPACAEPLIDGEGTHTAKRHHWWLAIMGRLKPALTVAQASANANAISPAVFESTVPPNYRPDSAGHYKQYKLTALAADSGVSSLRNTYENPLYLLLSIAALVLLIACANLANLMLARASVREREIAVRLAIGANRMRLIRQLLAESALLAATGIAGGLALAQVLSRSLVSFLTTEGNPLFLDLRADWRVLFFTSAAGALTCIVFGLYPALRATQTAPAAVMKGSSRGMTASRERFGARRVLAVTQVSLSLVLLVGALLFVRSLNKLLTHDAGFNQDNLLVVGVDISHPGYSPERRTTFYTSMLRQFRATPGVDNAATASIVPIEGDGWNEVIEIDGRVTKERLVPWFDRVSPGYFAAMRTPLRSGRDFNERDTRTSTDVAVVNEKFRDKFLAGENPIGRRFRMVVGPGEPPQAYQIVGVVANAKYQSLRDDFVPIVYVSADQNKEPSRSVEVIVRSRTPAGPLTDALKKSVLGLNPNASITFQSFSSQVSESLLRERLMAALSGFFGILAAVLATIGLYGVISYMVARRRNEIGIRIALGANRGRVLRMILREAGMLLAIGLVVGAGLSLAAGRAAESMLYGLKSWDPSTIEIAIGLLATAALAASLVPALRAARLNPMTALREE